MNDLPGPRCGRMVDGTFVSYPCWLDQFHEGPCVAKEVPVSATRREQWLAAQAAQNLAAVPAPAAAPAPATPAVGVPAPPPALSPLALADPAEREAAMLAQLGRPFPDLPSWAQQGIISHSSMLSVALLWSLATEQFDRGAPTVTISREFLERLVTPSTRAFISTFIIKE